MSAITQNKQGLKVLVTGSILQLFLGILYVWSVFVKPVSDFYSWSVDGVKLTSSFMLCFFVIGILAGGKAQTKIGVKLTTLIGGLMVAVGMLATALIPAGGNAPVFLIYLFYGIIGGFGVGAGYNANISTAQKWFPQNRGFATGISVCAFGLSTVIFAPLVTMLNQIFAVNYTFLILAGAFAAAVLLLFSFIKTPEQVPNAAAPVLKGKQYTTTEMIKTPRFYLIALSLMFGTSVFFIILPSLKDLAADRGLASFATGIVMFTGIANALGRLGTPLLSDKIGREMADVIILAVTALGAFGLCFANGILLIVIIAAVAFCYGGYSGLYPVLTSENFGIKNVGSNYGAVMVGFMLSALLFPIVINKIGDQQLRFFILGALAAVGAVLVVILKLMNLKKVKETE
ncbi:MAG: MFS transporter [Spirochaetaceae bacterium]|jgi:OFA family oxalate/formate antiporter-like MFS transporter|nr:MFS transporter [Spirochaetaceae bacterium]